MDESLVRRYREALDQIRLGSGEPPRLDDTGEALIESMKGKSPEQLKEENDNLYRKLESLGVELTATATLYRKCRDKTSRYSLIFPLPEGMPLFIPFEQMDHETQYYTLSAAWSHRRKEGHEAMYYNRLEEAQATFEECVRRAEQLGSSTLIALSYTCLARLAMQRGDRTAELLYLSAVQEADAAESEE